MIATSFVQSSQLLAAGIDPKSADMYWGHVDFGGRFQITLLPANPHLDINSTISPAWSLSALWQMIHEAGVIYEFSTDTGPDELIESLVTIICSHYAPAPSEQ